MKYRIELIIGENHSRKGVAFLLSNDGRINAKNIFKNLDKKSKYTLMTRFEYWQSGKTHKKYFHSWDQSEFQGKYTNCFVFKLRNHRFYGFLRSKIKKLHPEYQVCVLVLYAEKEERETYEPDLKKVETIRTTLAVQKAVNDFFREKGES
jgi:hypothetical protein